MRTFPYRPTASPVYRPSRGANWVVNTVVILRRNISFHWFSGLDSKVKGQVLGSAHFSLYIDDVASRISTLNVTLLL